MSNQRLLAAAVFGLIGVAPLSAAAQSVDFGPSRTSSGGGTVSVSIPVPAGDTGEQTLSVTYAGDLAFASEFLTVEVEGTPVGGNLDGGAACTTSFNVDITIPDAVYTAAATDGTVDILFDASPDATGLCGTPGFLFGPPFTAFNDFGTTFAVQGSLTVTPPPTIALTSNTLSLAAGETAQITFTLSEASTDFEASDVTVTGGTLSGFSGSGTSYTATFTPTVGATQGLISVPSGVFTNSVGIANADGGDPDNLLDLSLDTVLPTIAVTSSTPSLAAGQTAQITFTLSEASTDFDASDVVVNGGVLSGFAGAGASYTATFTPNGGATLGVISVPSGAFTDAAGNANADGADPDNTVTLPIDTVLPTIAVTSNTPSLAAGQEAQITFTLSEASTDFDASDVTVTGGVLSGFSGAGTSYTATFTPAAGATQGVISVPSGVFTDAAGNANADGADADNTVTLSLDTASPTIAVTSDTLSLIAGQTAQITFTLSEASTDFDASDVIVTGGVLSGFSGVGTSYTATFTPDAGAAQGVISVVSGVFTDAAGNVNTDGADADNTVTLSLDTTLPTIAVTSDTASLGEGQTAVITFTLSEASTDFEISDVTATGGTLSGFSGSGTSYTATFTPDAGATEGVVSVASGVFTDAAGNANADGADPDNTVTLTLDTVRPSVELINTAQPLSSTDPVTITAVFSEPVQDFDDVPDDVVVVNGALTAISAAVLLPDNREQYVLSITPTGNGDVEVTVPENVAQDALGNANLASNTVVVENRIVEITREQIAGFMLARANNLAASQPRLTRFLRGTGCGQFNADANELSATLNGCVTQGNVWAEVSGSWAGDGAYTLGTVASHAFVNPNLLVGAMLQFDYADDPDNNASGRGWMVGPYYVARVPDQPLYFEGRLLYGQSDNDITPIGTYTDSFSTERWLAQLRAEGEYQVNATTLIPLLDFTYSEDQQLAYTDSLGNRIDGQTVSLMQMSAGVDFRTALPSQTGSLELTGGLSGVYSSTTGASEDPDFENWRARTHLGLDYDTGTGATYRFGTFVDGVGAGYESYGAILGVDLRF